MTEERKAEILSELMKMKEEVINYHNISLKKVEEYHRRVEWSINKKEEIDELVKKMPLNI
jgi:2,3-bisphosphoglycerate-independent phosphoglycerate mutase